MTRTERENTRSDRGLYLRRKPLSNTLYVETPAPRKGGGNHGGNVRGCFLNKGRNAHGRSRHAIAVSHPGSRCAEKSAHRCHSFGSQTHFAPPLLIPAVPLVFLSRSENIGVTAVVLSTSLPCLILYATCRVAALPAEAHCPRLAPKGPGGLDPHRRARFKRCGENKKNSRLAPPLATKTKDNREFKNLKASFC